MGPEHPSTLQGMANLASIYLLRGKYAEAEALYRSSFEIRGRTSGAEHPDTITSIAGLIGSVSYFGWSQNVLFTRRRRRGSIRNAPALSLTKCPVAILLLQGYLMIEKEEKGGDSRD
jgi:hypothetical protein